ncbi:MAG TPA: hypothetical protein VI384_05030 [Candidatus Dormibacteraeota bacterium]
MADWRRFAVAAAGALSLVAAGASSAAADEGGTLVRFESMTPITGAAVGAVNDRGLTGGGLPWMISSGIGSVDRRGNVDVTVHGLVLAAGANAGKNPIGSFAATVSCLTPHGIVNVTTGLFPATVSGDSSIHDTVALPHPCKSPQVFVGAVLGGHFRWFAVSNASDEEDGD